jgi:hypothetical protein
MSVFLKYKKLKLQVNKLMYTSIKVVIVIVLINYTFGDYSSNKDCYGYNASEICLNTCECVWCSFISDGRNQTMCLLYPEICPGVVNSTETDYCKKRGERIEKLGELISTILISIIGGCLGLGLLFGFGLVLAGQIYTKYKGGKVANIEMQPIPPSV